MVQKSWVKKQLMTGLAMALDEESPLGLASPYVYRSERSSLGWQRVAPSLDLSWLELPAASHDYVKCDLLIIHESRHQILPLK